MPEKIRAYLSPNGLKLTDKHGTGPALLRSVYGRAALPVA